MSICCTEPGGIETQSHRMTLRKKYMIQKKVKAHKRKVKKNGDPHKKSRILIVEYLY